jgi:hypothetical protein
LPPKDEAERYVADIPMRWLAVRESRAVESDEPVNHAIVDDELKAVVAAFPGATEA